MSEVEGASLRGEGDGGDGGDGGSVCRGCMGGESLTALSEHLINMFTDCTGLKVSLCSVARYLSIIETFVSVLYLF